jgi:hypothetical protein
MHRILCRSQLPRPTTGPAEEHILELQRQARMGNGIRSVAFSRLGTVQLIPFQQRIPLDASKCKRIWLPSRLL